MATILRTYKECDWDLALITEHGLTYYRINKFLWWKKLVEV